MIFLDISPDLTGRPQYSKGDPEVFQIRLHGRGGQGVVTAAEMLALAGFMEGHKAQAFPSFGSERTGAPVVAFARLSSVEIRLREPIQEPDVVLIQDRTLLESVPVFLVFNQKAMCSLIQAVRPKSLVSKILLSSSLRVM